MARFAGTALTDYFNTPDFTQVGKTAMQGQSMQRNAATKAEGLVHGAGINSMAEVAQAGFQADAIKAQGAAQGQSSMMSGIGSMVSGIAGGFGAMGSGGAGSALPGGGVRGAEPNSYYGTGGKYGSFQPFNATY
jgi:hypothetical protein